MRNKKQINTILILVVIIISFFNLISSVSANELTFSDVTDQTLYFEDITKVKELGGVVESDEFRPDEQITFAEAVTIAEKLFGNVENLPDWDWWSNQSKELKPWKNEWNIDQTLILGRYLEPISKDVAAHIIMQTNNDKCVLKEAIGLSSTHTRKFYYTFLVRGYKDTEDAKNAFIGLTRAEFCHMIVWYMENCNEPWPDVETNVKIKNGVNTDYMNFMEYEVSVELLKIPAEIRTAFANCGYNIILSTEENWNNYVKKHKVTTDAVGIYAYKDNIYLREGYSESIIHEIGHFVGFHSSKTHKNCNLLINNDEEIQGLRQIKGRDYCTTNSYEYFAEAFDAYINHPAKLQKLAPLTYDMVENAIATFIN